MDDLLLKAALGAFAHKLNNDATRVLALIGEDYAADVPPRREDLLTATRAVEDMVATIKRFRSLLERPPEQLQPFLRTDERRTKFDLEEAFRDRGRA